MIGAPKESQGTRQELLLKIAIPRGGVFPVAWKPSPVDR